MSNNHLHAGKSVLPVKPERGRVAAYSKLLADQVLELVAAGLTPRRAAERLKISPASVRRWQREQAEFTRDLEIAREHGQDAYMDEILDKFQDAKPEDIPRLRELAHHARWLASKLKPQTYGERTRPIDEAPVAIQINIGRQRETEGALIENEDAKDNGGTT